ncbi:unnamed protein product [Prunus armeniaca]
MNLPSHNDINAFIFWSQRNVEGVLAAAKWEVENIGYILKCGSKLSPCADKGVCLGALSPNHVPEHLGFNMNVSSFRNKDGIQHPCPTQNVTNGGVP